MKLMKERAIFRVRTEHPERRMHVRTILRDNTQQMGKAQKARDFMSQRITRHRNITAGTAIIPG